MAVSAAHVVHCPEGYLGCWHGAGEGDAAAAAAAVSSWQTGWGTAVAGVRRLKKASKQPVLPFFTCCHSYLATEVAWIIVTDVENPVTRKYNTLVVYLLTLPILSKAIRFWVLDSVGKREQKTSPFKGAWIPGSFQGWVTRFPTHLFHRDNLIARGFWRPHCILTLWANYSLIVSDFEQYGWLCQKFLTVIQILPSASH